jgi:O-antigen ligase
MDVVALSPASRRVSFAEVAPIGFGSPLFWAGVLAVLVSAAVDSTLGEAAQSIYLWSFLVQAAAFYFIYKKGYRGFDVLMVSLFILASLWPYISSVSVGDGFGSQIRSIFRVTLVLLFTAILYHSRDVMVCVPVVIGVYFGHVILQAIMVFWFMTGDYHYLDVKHNVVNAAIILFLAAFTKGILSHRIRAVFGLMFVYFFAVSVAYESRIMVLLPIASLLVFGVVRAGISFRAPVVAALIALPLVPVGLLAIDLPTLLAALSTDELATASNTERIMLMFIAVENIISDPLFGVGASSEFERGIRLLYGEIGKLTLNDANVHNVYLELGGLHGLPATVFFSVSLFYIFLKSASRDKVIFSAQSFLISLLMIEYSVSPFTGELRMDTFVVMTLCVLLSRMHRAERSSA